MTLEQALAQSVAAAWEHGGYTVCISEDMPSEDHPDGGFFFTVQKEAMPPHVTLHYDSLAECLREWCQGDYSWLEKHAQSWEPVPDEPISPEE